MKTILKLSTLGLCLAAGASLAASQPSLKNPGHWKSLPYHLAKHSQHSPIQWLGFYNTDVFDKVCHIEAAKKIVEVPANEGAPQTTEVTADAPKEKEKEKLKPFFSHTWVIKGGRNASFTLEEDWDDLTLDGIVVNGGCLATETGATPADEVFKDSGCGVNDPSCDQLCPADAANEKICANDHLLLSLDHESWTATYDAKTGASLSAKFTNTGKKDLYCQVVTFVKGVNSDTGDVVFVTAPAAPQALKAGEATTVAWGVENSELHNSNKIDASHPRIVAACSEEEIKENFWSTCNPLKRSECNWVVDR